MTHFIDTDRGTYKGFKITKVEIRRINVLTGKTRRGWAWAGVKGDIRLAAPTLKRLKYEINTDPIGFNQVTVTEV